MNQNSRVAILGGGGRTGSFVVTELLRQKYMLKVLTRKPESFVTKDSSIEVVAGDALDLNSIQSLLKDCHAVISTIGQRKGEPLVASMVTQNILQVMKEYHIDRYISVAGI